MPTVDTAFAQPAPPVSVSSPDGLLTATVDAANGGVLLFADFAGTPEQVVATNMYPDPLMSGGAAEWSMSGGTVANGPEGGIKVTGTGTGYAIATNTTDPVTGLGGASKLYVSADVRVTGTTGVGVQAAQVSATGVGLGNASNYVAAPAPGAWARVAFVLTLAAGTDHTSAVQLIRSSGATVGDTTEWRNLRASTVADGPFFTGSTASDGTYSYRWTGTPNASTSQKYIPGVAAVVADKVRFYRGDGTLVRSGDPAWAPGGTAVAYDHEAPVGGSVAYYAVPETLSGAQGAATATLAVSVPEPTDVRSLWLKSPLQPALSALVWVEDPPQIASAARTSVTPISGAPLGVTSWDVRTGMTTSMVIVTETAVEAATVEALLDAGPLLIQTKVAYDFPDAYWLPGDWTRDRVARMDNPMSRWTVPFVQCRRPATLDAPLMIPGNSYDTPPYVSYDAAKATGLSYNALLGVS